MQMIRRAIGNRVRFRYVLADSWFACAEMIGFIKSRRIGCHYLGMVKMGKAKYTCGGEEYTARALVNHLTARSCGKTCYCKRLRCHYVSACAVYGGHNIRLFFAKRDGGDWNALITTDLSLDFFEAYRIYSMRWSVEVLFKDCKTNLGLGRYQQRDFAAQIACTAITAMQYNILSVARRFSDYETVGGLFRDAAGCGTQLSVTERIWGLIQELAVKLAECFCKSVDFIMDLIINGSDKLAEICALYNDNC